MSVSSEEWSVKPNLQTIQVFDCVSFLGFLLRPILCKFEPRLERETDQVQSLKLTIVLWTPLCTCD